MTWKDISTKYSRSAPYDCRSAPNSAGNAGPCSLPTAHTHLPAQVRSRLSSEGGGDANGLGWELFAAVPRNNEGWWESSQSSPGDAPNLPDPALGCLPLSGLRASREDKGF